MLAATELRLMIHERDLPRFVLDRILSLARGELSDGRRYWMRNVGVVRESTRHSLNFRYTDDGSGQGWLVLNRIEGMGGIAFWYAGTERGIGAWNVLSVVFNDRRTVQAKMKRFVGVMKQAAEARYADAQAMLEQLDDRSAVNVLDGP